jgi:predicted nucleic acid-binding Zn ribbon protein
VRPIGGAIDRALRKLGLDRDVARVSAIDAWPAAARDIFGPSAEATRAVGLSDRALLVAVPDATWSGEIRLRERELLRAIGRRVTTDLEHIRAVPAASERHGDRSSDA